MDQMPRSPDRRPVRMPPPEPSPFLPAERLERKGDDQNFSIAAPAKTGQNGTVRARLGPSVSQRRRIDGQDPGHAPHPTCRGQPDPPNSHQIYSATTRGDAVPEAQGSGREKDAVIDEGQGLPTSPSRFFGGHHPSSVNQPADETIDPIDAFQWWNRYPSGSVAATERRGGGRGDEQEHHPARYRDGSIPEMEEGAVEPADRMASISEVDTVVTKAITILADIGMGAIPDDIAVPENVEMVIMPEEVSAVEEISYQEDPVTSALPKKEVMGEAEMLTIPENVLMASITKEEEALAEPPPMPGGSNEVDGDEFGFARASRARWWTAYPSTSSTSSLSPRSPLVEGRRRLTEEVLLFFRFVYLIFSSFTLFFLSFLFLPFFLSPDVGREKEAARQPRNVLPSFFCYNRYLSQG